MSLDKIWIISKKKMPKQAQYDEVGQSSAFTFSLEFNLKPARQ